MAFGEREVVLISNRHKGIIHIVAEVFGSEFHVHCYCHVKENFSSFLTKFNIRGIKGKENALDLLDQVAYAHLDTEYIVALDTLRTYNIKLTKGS